MKNNMYTMINRDVLREELEEIKNNLPEESQCLIDELVVKLDNITDPINQPPSIEETYKKMWEETGMMFENNPMMGMNPMMGPGMLPFYGMFNTSEKVKSYNELNRMYNNMMNGVNPVSSNPMDSKFTGFQNLQGSSLVERVISLEKQNVRIMRDLKILIDKVNGESVTVQLKKNDE